MPGDREDPIADTGMFRAFVAKGEPERAERKTSPAAMVLVAVAAFLIAAVLVWLLLG